MGSDEAVCLKKELTEAQAVIIASAVSTQATFAKWSIRV